MNQHIVQQLVFFEFALGETGSEMRTVNGNVESLQEVRKCAEVIFVSVSKHYCRDVVLGTLRENEKFGIETSTP